MDTMVKNAGTGLASALFLDRDGFPLSAPAEVTYTSDEIVRLLIPKGTQSVRLELRETGFILVRADSPDIDGKALQAIPQNATGISDGYLFINNFPRFLFAFDNADGGILTVPLTVTRLSAERAARELVSAINLIKREGGELRFEHDKIKAAFADIFNSRAWRAVRVYYKLKDFVRFIFYKTPFLKPIVLKTLAKLRIKQLSRSVIPKGAKINEAKRLYRASERRVIPLSDLPEPSECTLSLAVHLHLFYIDLLDTFYDWLSNIPYKYDLFVSVTKEEHIGKVLSRFESSNIGAVTVKAVENRGRDITPMINVFGKDLLKNDIFLHVHSKKSPHSGALKDWRDELLGSLLANPAHIRKILGLFTHNPKLGILYPEPHESFPYWSLTNHSNLEGMRDLSERINVPFDESDTYIDFPAGSMFWARSDALAPLLCKHADNFSPETGQVDGTPAHAAERAFCLIAQHMGYNPAQINRSEKTINIGPGLKNLETYIATDYSDALKYVSQFKRVVFDLFGTLLVSDTPEFLWLKMEERTFEGFAKSRKEAEEVTQLHGGAPDIHNVYAEFSRLTGINAGDCEHLKSLEFNLLLESAKPRAVMTKMLKTLSSRRTQIVIACDTVWTKAYIKKLMERCGIDTIYDTFISSEFGYTKQNGSMYDYLKVYFKCQSFLNIGDNEQSDVQTANSRRIHALHVMNPETMARVVGFFDDKMTDDPFCLLELLEGQNLGALPQTPLLF